MSVPIVGNKALPGYPQPTGAKIQVVFDHCGPASYNNTGTYATSGETLLANGGGLNFGGFDFVRAMDSSDGLYFAVIVPNLGGDANSMKSVVIHWFVRSTGAEVANGVNLSGSAIRIAALMV